MNRNDVMPDITELSEAKRALLEKYLRGDLMQSETTADVINLHTQSSPDLLPNASSRVQVIEVQSGESKRPFFYVHVHVIGGALYSFTLAHDLGADQPFYVLEPYNFEGMQTPPTLETMAAAYIESMRSIQPEGPYLLGGFCGGGLIVFEMARQLHAQGQQVDLLVLIEAVDGPGPDTFRMFSRRIVGGFLRRSGALMGLSPDKQLDWFLRMRHLYLLLRYPEYRESQRLSLITNAEGLRQDWIGMFVWMIADYIPHQYPGKLTYFWANEKLSSRRARRDKGEEAKELEVHVIPGNHWSCRAEYIHSLAEHLSTCLGKVQTAAPG
jgi:thioesterase domain-containing protein